MRITCPNCQSQYDVDPAMIPAEGRDVQCSSCAHTWLQKPESAEDAAAEAAAPEIATEDAQEGSDQSDEPAKDANPADVGVVAGAGAGDKLHAALESASEAKAEAEKTETNFLAEDEGTSEDAEPEEGSAVAEESDEKTDAQTEDAETEDTGPADPAEAVDDAKEIAEDALTEDIDAVADAVNQAADDSSDMAEELADDAFKDAADAAEALVEDVAEDDDPSSIGTNVADILREEAEREVTQRRGEDAPSAIEPQGELELQETAPSDLLRERLDRMRGDGVPQSTVAATLKAATSEPLEGPRRERLPDIEDIKTTLRPGEHEDASATISPAEMTKIRQSGFRLGFSVLVVAAAAAVAAYVFAPQIIGLIPSSEPTMISYVDAANTVRDGIDRIMARAISGINGLSASVTDAG